MKHPPILPLLLVIAALPLAGCKLLGGDCHKPGVYTEADSIPPLKVPPGLDAPDTRAALKVPDLTEPQRARGPNEPCLDEPPRYTEPKSKTAKPQA